MKNLVNKVIRSSTRVWKALGPGFNECIYHKALETEFRLNNISYNTEAIIPFTYMGEVVGHGRIDLVVCKKLIVELKATSTALGDAEELQLGKYMKFSDIKHGMLIQFSQKKLGKMNIMYIDNNFSIEKFSIDR